jgi:hypothetical protein
MPWNEFFSRECCFALTRKLIFAGSRPAPDPSSILKILDSVPPGEHFRNHPV